MKLYLKLLLGLFILCLVTVKFTYAQGTAGLSIENSQVNGGFYNYEIHITPTNDWGAGNRKTLGDCSWAFDFNSTALSDPQLTFVGSEVDPSEGYTHTVLISLGKIIVATDLDDINFEK